jgi:hypothetical protein
MPAPTSLEVGAWLVCLVAVVAGVNKVMKFFDRFKETPPPSATYQPKGDYITHREFKELRDQVDELSAEMRETFAEVRREMAHDKEIMNAAAEARAEKLHTRISEVLVHLTRIEMTRSK